RAGRFATARAMARALDDIGGKWMYDADKRAAFMRGLFADRIDATRRLLESASKSEITEEYRRDTHTLTEDPGAVFPELQADTDPESLPDESDLAAAVAEPAPPAASSPPPAAGPAASPRDGSNSPEMAEPAPASPAKSEDRSASRRRSLKWPLRVVALLV